MIPKRGRGGCGIRPGHPFVRKAEHGSVTTIRSVVPFTNECDGGNRRAGRPAWARPGQARGSGYAGLVDHRPRRASLQGDRVSQPNVYEMQIADLHGKPLDLAQFRGTAVLVVNVASR